MNINVASQNQGVIAWTGTAAKPVDVRHHVNFGFTFHVTADIATDAIFNFQAAPPSNADHCVPGTFVDVPQTIICDWLTMSAGPKSEVTIPAGTLKGAICTGTLPCKPDAFIQLAAVSGDTANIEVVAVLGGPR